MEGVAARTGPENRPQTPASFRAQTAFPSAMPNEPLVTPDGRYIVVRGRLWRRTNPNLPEETRQALVHDLMQARRVVRSALPTGGEPLAQARAAVDRAKRLLGERGPVWWDDGAEDLNRRMVAGTVYAGWFEGL